VSQEEIDQIKKEYLLNYHQKLLNFFASVRAFGTAYLIIDPIMPSTFNIKESQKITINELQNAKKIDLIIANAFEMYDSASIANSPTIKFEKQDLKNLNSEIPYMYYGIKFHKSRVIKMTRNDPPLYVKQRLYGHGGTSIFEDILDELEQLYQMQANALEMVTEAKIDIISQKGLVDNELENNGSNIAHTMEQKLAGKSFYSTLLIDGDTTEYQQKQLNLNNLDKLLNFFQMQPLQASGIPPKRLAGLNTTGFSDSDKTIEEFYNRDLQVIQNWGLKVITQIVELLFWQKHDFIPRDLKIEFLPTDTLNQLELQTLKNQKLDNVLKIHNILELSKEQLIQLLTDANIVNSNLDNAKINLNFNNI
jgi:phage-related protein (TIGR01555 family)